MSAFLQHAHSQIILENPQNILLVLKSILFVCRLVEVIKRCQHKTRVKKFCRGIVRPRTREGKGQFDNWPLQKKTTPKSMGSKCCFDANVCPKDLPRRYWKFGMESCQKYYATPARQSIITKTITIIITTAATVAFRKQNLKLGLKQ